MGLNTVEALVRPATRANLPKWRAADALLSLFNPVDAVMAYALADATRLRFTKPPSTRDRVWEAMQAAG